MTSQWSYHPGKSRGLRELLPGLLLCRPGKKEDEPEGNFPCHVEKTAQLNCASGKWKGTSQAHGKCQHKGITGDYSSQIA
jgi:hypothetical protein